MIVERFREAAFSHRHELAIIDGDCRITYARLLDEVDRARNWLRGALNLDNRFVIAACLRNSWQSIASFFAVAESGGILLLCNPNWRAGELRRIAEQLRIDGVITTEDLRAEWDLIADVLPPGSVLTWEKAPEFPSAGIDPPVTRSADEPLAYLLTSGSTGAPKVVPRSDRNLNFGATRLADALEIPPASRWLCTIPFFHSWGLGTGMLLPLLRGSTSVLMPQFHAAQCAELIRRERVNVLMASPFAYGFLVDCVSDASALSTLQRCFWSGSRMKAAVEETWRDRFGIRLRPWYGMSEAHAISIDLAPEGLKERPDGFVGAPFAGVDVCVFDPDGIPLGTNETGEIAVRSDGVMSGYVGETDGTGNFFYGPFFRTGDLGRLDASGNLYLSGRARVMINTAGLKVDPVEIEQAVETLAGVAACRVDSVPGGPTGELIRARVLLREGCTVSRRDVIEACRRQLAEYKLPRVIEFSDAPRSHPAGKMPK